MLNQFSRTQLLIGAEAINKLTESRVAVFGIGGVGGYVCEALVRSGVGHFDLIDDDKVCLTNLNRQILATRKTVGKYKAEVMAERMQEINPEVDIRIHKCFFLPENADDFPFDEYNYVAYRVTTSKPGDEIRYFGKVGFINGMTPKGYICPFRNIDSEDIDTSNAPNRMKTPKPENTIRISTRRSWICQKTGNVNV